MKYQAMGWLLLALAVWVTGAPAEAAEFARTYEFALDDWHEIDEADGPVTLHRIRIDRKEARISKSALARPHNQEYLQTVRFQLEYTNEATQKWKSRVTVRWLDEDGTIIDGFSANEDLDKKSARKVSQASFPTLKYGLERAKTLQVEIRFEP